MLYEHGHVVGLGRIHTVPYGVETIGDLSVGRMGQWCAEQDRRFTRERRETLEFAGP